MLIRYLKNLKTSPRAAKDKQWRRMRPAGRQFDMPAVEVFRPLTLLTLYD